MTSKAFASVLPWFPYVLSVSITLFAYSTMVSWCYYGERGWIYLLDHIGEGVGLRTVVGFRIIFVLATFVGAVTKLSADWRDGHALLRIVGIPDPERGPTNGAQALVARAMESGVAPDLLVVGEDSFLQVLRLLFSL